MYWVFNNFELKNAVGFARDCCRHGAGGRFRSSGQDPFCWARIASFMGTRGTVHQPVSNACPHEALPTPLFAAGTFSGRLNMALNGIQYRYVHRVWAGAELAPSHRALGTPRRWLHRIAAPLDQRRAGGVWHHTEDGGAYASDWWVVLTGTVCCRWGVPRRALACISGDVAWTARPLSLIPEGRGRVAPDLVPVHAVLQ